MRRSLRCSVGNALRGVPRYRRFNGTPRRAFPTGLACLIVVASLGRPFFAPAHEPALETPDFKARFALGSLVSLQQWGGERMVRPSAEPRGVGIHCVAGAHWAGAAEHDETEGVADRAKFALSKFARLEGATAENVLRVDPATRELTLRQQARAPSKGVWGVSWTIADIPRTYAILVPGNSGLRLTDDSPATRYEFEYPISWEAQLVIVEGRGRGFYVWAEDPKGRYKRLVVERGPSGWRLELITINYAPFDELTACESVLWRIGTYEGDWRVPARKYRQWSQSHFHPTPVENQRPAWVKDIRGCVIMGQDTKILEALPRRFDPKQTLIYLPSWRTSGYDRNYPEYDKPVPELEPFVRRAHAMGFRVMLHVNYFGVDPLNPLYKEFERYQVRDPFGRHEKQWWLWTDADPIIKFAYINPAAKKWRDLFVAAMAKLCRQTGVDGLHLDQTLCIFNDHNGLIDGLSMLDGNVALHRDLRQALPEVAISGEGLDEVTGRYEAFAQRHVSGLDHTHGRWSRPWLEMAHPISSYLLRPYTVIYGYLGCAPPETDQLYAAWQEAYQHWGVIPTMWPALDSLHKPAGFARQFFDELALWQKDRLAIDLEAPWPTGVVFPYRTADGRPAVRTRDRRLVCDGREISRTVNGAGEVEGTGTIPGWRAFDERRLLGLNPERWYPYFTEPRDPRGFHVCELPKDLVVEAVTEADDLAIVRTRSANTVVADLGRLIGRAVCGSRPFAGRGVENRGPLVDSADGALFQGDSDVLSAHPPWKGAGTGVAFARYEIDLPAEDRLELKTEVALDPGAVGPDKSDGVTFTAVARLGDRQLRAQLHNATAEQRPLALDLTPLAGKRVTVELSVDPGPKRNPSFDWARWRRPRIERHGQAQGSLAVAGGKDWKLAVGPAGAAPVETTGGRRRIEVPLPGTVFFLDKQPDDAAFPVDLSRQPWRVILLSDSGLVVASPAPFVGLSRQPNTVGGIAREGLFAHPPDHGRLVALMPTTLPSAPATLRTWIGIRDKSRSDGVDFIVEVNGREAARKRMLPGKWESLTVDLGPWAGKPAVLALITDSDGPYTCDWAAWGEPRIEAK
jgi:hypothetical protein